MGGVHAVMHLPDEVLILHVHTEPNVLADSSIVDASASRSAAEATAATVELTAGLDFIEVAADATETRTTTEGRS